MRVWMMSLTKSSGKFIFNTAKKKFWLYRFSFLLTKSSDWKFEKKQFSLAQLIHAVGDSGENETKDNSSRIDLVQRDTQTQIQKLTSTVDRLRNILMNSDRLKLRDAIEVNLFFWSLRLILRITWETLNILSFILILNPVLGSRGRRWQTQKSRKWTKKAAGWSRTGKISDSQHE